MTERNLYEITGNVLDINTMLLNRNELKALQLNDERYRWLRNGNAYRPEEWGCTGGAQLDEWIDEERK